MTFAGNISISQHCEHPIDDLHSTVGLIGEELAFGGMEPLLASSKRQAWEGVHCRTLLGLPVKRYKTYLLEWKRGSLKPLTFQTEITTDKIH